MIPGGRARVLVVDDALPNVKIIGAALRGEHQVLVATNGPDALRLARKEPQPDLILLDVVMPDMDGHEVCRQLQASEATRGIPVIFLTARSEVDDETQGLALGAVDYITKPFSLAIVAARVRTHLELKRHRDFFEDLSGNDGLTGIPNRRRFDQILDREWRRAQRAGTLLSVLLGDVDHFKRFNDTYGHLAGDDCLKRVGRALAETLQRGSDFVARYGGEEFAAVLAVGSHDDARGAAEALREAVAALGIAHEASPVRPCVTLSLGAATVTPSAHWTATALVEAADRALYEAKLQGRDRVASVQLGASPPAADR